MSEKKRSGVKKIKLTKEELDELMNVNAPTYRTTKNGRVRQNG